MKCENLQFNLPIYLDDILNEAERAVVENHLVQCPVCRQKLADFQMLRNGLRVLPRPAFSGKRLTAMRNRVAREAEFKQGKFASPFSEEWREWMQMRLMPYTVGTAASLLFTITLLWTLLSAAYIPEKTVELAKNETPLKSTVLLTNSNSNDFVSSFAGDLELNPASFAATRYSVSGASPSLNPQGALVALTKSIVRGKMKDDEVVIVADVFGDGLAQIAEIVEPSSDVQAVRELERALKNDPRYAAPFVPANLDGRSNMVRVIFKINRVDIQTHTKTKAGQSRLR
ncbi:MAG: zf-HC2 domain-containing protein [Pyrinomonadaceae bacterium]|nr:zf-HC2 domain-containing protein [Pyrinomonadaceae bacterium]